MEWHDTIIINKSGTINKRVLRTGGGEACTNQCSWMHKAEWCGGLAERLGRVEWLGRAAEAAELCGVAELLGVPLTDNDMVDHDNNQKEELEASKVVG